MRRDQLLFLIVGLALGLVVGAIIGAVVARPDIVGASAPAPPPPSDVPSGGPQAAAGIAPLDGGAKPNDYAAQVAAGNYFYDRGQWAEAEAAYRRALAARADDPNVVTDHGVTLHQLGRDAEALAEFDRSIRLDPRHAMTALNGTVVSLAAGDKARAATWLARLEQIDPRHPAIPRFKEELGQK